jgi:hypothetical protein
MILLEPTLLLYHISSAVIACEIGRACGKGERTTGAFNWAPRNVGTKGSWLNCRPLLDCPPCKSRRSITIDLGDVEVMQTIRLAALIAFGLGTPAMAAATVPEEYQGVWAAARDCKENFQNVLSNVVNREFAACRVMQVLSSSRPESHTNTLYLNCGDSQSREIWHDENIEGTDYLVIIQFEHGAEAGRPSIDMYKRCPEIPLSEIPLSDIPGNPVADTASEEKIASPSRGVQIVRQRPFPHSRASRMRKHGPQ